MNDAADYKRKAFLKHRGSPKRLFYFYIFQKKNYRNIFLVSDFTVLYPYHPAGGRQGGGRDLYVNKNKFILHRGPWREPTARQGGGRLPPQI